MTEGTSTIHPAALPVAVIVSVLIMVVSLVTTVVYVKHADNGRRDEQIAACERGNAIRATVNNIILEIGLAVAPVEFIDCQHVIN